MDPAYEEQIRRINREIENEDSKGTPGEIRHRVESNIRRGAPSNAEELMYAAKAAAVATICARCGQHLPGSPALSRYVPLPLCDVCAVQEAWAERTNNPLPFKLWRCCMNVPMVPPSEPPDPVPLKTPKLWHCSNHHGANASGYPVHSSFVVLKGSKVSRHLSDATGIKDLRSNLMNDGTIGSDYVFTRDYRFASCSTAASVVLGRNANGWLTWKDDSENPLDILRR